MNFLSNEGKNGFLETFLAMSHWETVVAVLVFFALAIGFWFFLKYIKIGFMYRVLIGLGIGLVFGIILQAIAGFPEHGLTGKYIPGTDTENSTRKEWAEQSNIWISLFKNVFMNAILLLTSPVVFIAIFRVTSKPGQRGVGRITLKGIAFLLSNVFVAFIITFWIGIVVKVGSGSGIASTAGNKAPTENVPLPEIIWNYFPTSFAGAWVEGAIIPLMVLGAVFGMSCKILNKRKPESMAAIRKAMDTGWDILISVLMTFMKIMPLAVMSMIASSLVSKPIGALESIGKVLGIGYVGILIGLGYTTLLVFLGGVKLKKWWGLAARPLVQAFATQSSNATLPITMEVLKDEMKINEKVVGTIAPLSTSMGLMACAGVQAGLITSFLWTGVTGADATTVHKMGLMVFFILSLVITMFASLGIAGVPGTAGVVTAGVLGGLGFSAYFAPVYAIVGALDGLFDMGRTGLNVFAGVAVTTLVAKTEGEIEEDSPILSQKALERQKVIRQKISDKEDKFEQKQLAMKTLMKEKAAAKKAKAGPKNV